jgi:hypothetical protein
MLNNIIIVINLLIPFFYYHVINRSYCYYTSYVVFNNGFINGCVDNEISIVYNTLKWSISLFFILLDILKLKIKNELICGISDIFIGWFLTVLK